MYYSECERMTVSAMGIDRDGRTEMARNGNYRCCKGKDAVGACGCTHAEDMLLQKLPNPITVFVTHAPCINCAKLLVEAGVQKVFYLKTYRLAEGVEYLKKYGVATYHSDEINY